MLSTLDAVRLDKSPTETCCRILWRAETNFNDFQRSFYRFQCRQTLAVAARRVRCRHGVTHLSRKTKASFASDRRAFRSLSSLQRWKTDPIFTRVLLLALLFRKSFPLLLFICHLYLSVARLFTERSLLHMMSRHAPYSWLATSLFWYSAPTLKNYIPHLLKKKSNWPQIGMLV